MLKTSLSPCILDQWLQKKLPSHTAFPHALYAEQWRRVCATVAYAKQHARFYKQNLAHIDIKNFSLEHMHSLPFTTANDLQQWEQFLCISLGDIERVVSLQTSGTTNAPKRLAFSEEDLAATEDFFRVGMSQLIHPEQRLLALWPGAHLPHGVSALLRKALTPHSITVFDGNPAVTAQTLAAELQKYNPHTIVGAPSQLAILAQIVENAEHFSLPKPLALRAVLSSGEHVSEALQNTLQQLGLLHLDHYGITEAGYSIGVQCPATQGYHIRELDIFIEIISLEEPFLPCSEGHMGEVVITTLGRKAMPLIRYRTGDVATLLSGPCACGSPLRRLSSLQGRIKRDGKKITIEHCNKGNFYERTAQAAL